MITDYELSKIVGNYSEKIRHQKVIRTFLILANLIMWVIGFLFLTGCEPAVDPSRSFLIRQGDHYASPKLSESLQSQKLVFEAKFNESAIYDFGDLAAQSNKNKLMGFCDSNSLPHENSARFAWQWFNNRLEIYGYCYVNSNRQEQFIGVVPLNQYNHFELEPRGDQYIFRLNNAEPIAMNRGQVNHTGFYFKLWPYFGGDRPAPHDVAIAIKTIY